MYSTNRNRAQRGWQISPLIMTLFMRIWSELDKSTYKPPVTLFLLAVNVLVHIHPYPNVLGYNLADWRGNGLLPSAVVWSWVRGDIQWNRLIFSSIIHADDMHLYYNMLSLLWKGINLERTMGSVNFALLVAFSLVVSHSLLVVLSYLLHFTIGLDGYQSSYDVTAIGFSAVLFSLKFVWNQSAPSTTTIYGITFPTKHVAWAELVFTSLLNPQASFLGHLAGILAGWLYLALTQELVIPRWLRQLITPTARYTYHSGTLGGSNNTNVNTIHVDLSDDEEIIELESVDELRRQQHQDLSSDALRARRLQHAQQQQQQQLRFRR